MSVRVYHSFTLIFNRFLMRAFCLFFMLLLLLLLLLLFKQFKLPVKAFEPFS